MLQNMSISNIIAQILPMLPESFIALIVLYLLIVLCIKPNDNNLVKVICGTAYSMLAFGLYIAATSSSIFGALLPPVNIIDNVYLVDKLSFMLKGLLIFGSLNHTYWLIKFLN
jgi:hypothetical protein